MGVMTDLWLARPEEADAVAAEWPPQGRSRWPDVEMKGQSPVTLGQLLAIIRDVEWTPEPIEKEAEPGDGPAHLMLKDPDGNTILIDQH